jgi:hypothetical protein
VLLQGVRVSVVGGIQQARPHAVAGLVGVPDPGRLSAADARFRAVITSPAALRLAARTSRHPRNPWRQGACLVLAEAVAAWLGGAAALFLVTDSGCAVHVFAGAGGLALDGGGITTPGDLLAAIAEGGNDHQEARS